VSQNNCLLNKHIIRRQSLWSIVSVITCSSIPCVITKPGNLYTVWAMHINLTSNLKLTVGWSGD